MLRRLARRVFRDRSSNKNAKWVLPNGLPRTCSLVGDTHAHTRPEIHVLTPITVPVASEASHGDQELTESQRRLGDELRALVGGAYVHSSESSTRTYTQGARLGKGTALAVCQPGSLEEAVQVLQACVAADVAVIPQGSSTLSLTLSPCPEHHL